jgi:6 kDa early secretory antigenic target
MSGNGHELLVQFGALEAASQNISKAINTMRAKLGELEAAARPMVDTWDGAAQAAYMQRQEMWRKSAEDITNILSQIKSALDASAQHYAATERANTNLFT